MKLPLYPLLTAALLGLITCRSRPEEPAPVIPIYFTTQVTPATDYPVSVRFISGVESADSYQWSFSDGQTATQPAVSLNFPKSGVYQATLTVRKASQSISVTKSFTVPFRQFSVAMIYLIPKGGSFDPSLLEAVKQLSPAIQDLYTNQLGKTFSINDPIVDTLQSSRYSYQYGQSPFDILQSMGAEVNQKLGSRVNKSQQVVLIFYPIAFNNFLGLGGLSIKYGEETRTGIISGSACRSLTAVSASDRNLGLWTTAHELGHALGLSHNLMPNSLMLGAIDSTGYVPNVPRPQFSTCFLTAADKAVLSASPYLR